MMYSTPDAVSRRSRASYDTVFVNSSDRWLVFPHEIQGLSREEILANKPVDASFFDPV